MQLMLILLPIIGAIIHSFDLILSKISLSKEHVPYKDFCFYFFLFVFIIMLPFSQFFGSVPKEVMQPAYFFSGIAVLVLAFIYNLIFYHGMKSEEMSEVENLYMLQGFFAVMLAFIFFKEERHLVVLIPALIASFALILSHIKKKHLSFKKIQLIFLLAVFFMAVESLFLKKLLEIFNPYILYMTRCGILALAFFLYKKPDVKRVKNHFIYHMFFIALFAALSLVIFYWTIQNFGLVYTNLIFTLSPIIVLFYSYKFFGEKISWKKISASAVIIACIILVEILRL